jgi:hypothetical protein
MPETNAKVTKAEVTALIKRLNDAIDRVEQNVQRLLNEKASRA